MAHEHKITEKIGWTILLNIVITISEYIGGFISGSLALLSDAGHNLSDVISLILGYFGEKVSERKSTKRHTFGFKRTEVFTALINAISLFAIAIFILVEAINRIKSPQTISLGLMIGVGLVGLFGNFVSILILNKEKDKSINMRAAYIHLFYDTLSSVFVIIGGIVIYFTGFMILDTLLSIIIALMIIYSGFGIIKSSLHIFMQGVPEGIDFDKVYNSISKTKGVKSVHNLHIWAIDSNEIFLSCHVSIDKQNYNGKDDLIRKINKSLRSKFKIEHTTIQLEDIPCTNNKLCNK